VNTRKRRTDMSTVTAPLSLETLRAVAALIQAGVLAPADNSAALRIEAAIVLAETHQIGAS
jgi:hypothetical protein